MKTQLNMTLIEQLEVKEKEYKAARQRLFVARMHENKLKELQELKLIEELKNQILNLKSQL